MLVPSPSPSRSPSLDRDMNIMINKVDVPWSKPAPRGEKVYRNCLVDENEKEDDIKNTTTAYDLLSDYPVKFSRSYTGPRNCKGNSFGERDVSMMKERLGIAKIIATGRARAGVPIRVDSMGKVSIALGRELLRCLGAEDVKEGKSSNKPGWDRALRRLIKTSEVLPPSTKSVLARYSSILRNQLSNGPTCLEIAIEDER